MIPDPATYHVFKNGDKSVLIPIGRPSPIVIDEVALEALSLPVGCDCQRAAQRLAGKLPAERVEACLHELAEWVAAGAFQLQKPIQSAVRSCLAMQPDSLTLLVTMACNLKCRYCYARRSTGESSSSADMSTEVADQAVRFMLSRAPELRELHITFFGGEPLLNLRLIEHVVRRCEEITSKTGKYFTFGVTTNGTLINDDVARFLRDKRFSVMLSLDAPPEAHGLCRASANGAGSFDQIAQALALLRRRGISTTVRGTVSRANITRPELRRAIEAYAGIGVERLMLGTALRSVGTPRDALEMSLVPCQARELPLYQLELADQAMCRTGEIPRQVRLCDGWKGVILSFAKNATRSPRCHPTECGACTSMTAVGPSGSLFPCHRFASMPKHSVGDVWSGLDLEAVERFFAAHTHATSGCRRCWAFHLCSMRCYYHLACPSGRFVCPAPSECHEVWGLIERAAALFVKWCSENPLRLQTMLSSPAPGESEARTKSYLVV